MVVVEERINELGELEVAAKVSVFFLLAQPERELVSVRVPTSMLVRAC